MNFRSLHFRIFTSIFLTAFVVSLASIFVLARLAQDEVEKRFFQTHRIATETLASTLLEFEYQTETLMLSAARYVDLWMLSNGLPSESSLKKIRSDLGVTHLFITDSNGVFVRSTNENPDLIPNIFSFCGEYESKIQQSGWFDVTPLIIPNPEPKPHKFLIYSSSIGRFIDVAVRADYVGVAAARVLRNYPELLSVEVFAPNNASLGAFSQQGWKPDKSMFSPQSAKSIHTSSRSFQTTSVETKVQMSGASCCQCVTSGLVELGQDYEYRFVATVSTHQLFREVEKIWWLFALGALALLFTALLLSKGLSELLLRGLGQLRLKIEQATVGGSGAQQNWGNIDEIAFISEKFDFMKRTIDEHQEALVKEEKTKAIASMVTAISHDVRKPFSLVRAVLLAFKDMRASEVPSFAAATLPEIDKSITQVDGLLQDVMQFGGDIALQLTEVTPERVIYDCLESTFRPEAGSEISIDYSADTEIAFHIDVHKVRRVFLNLFTNALEAMKGRGHLWIEVSSRGHTATVCIGNSGAFVAPQDRESIFETFVTAGKQDGTGLGLSIAKKWVEAHGGSIWCESHKDEDCPDGKVEFFFTLPISERTLGGVRPLIPKNSKDFALGFPLS